MPKVSIIVLQYNQSSRTLACLESLRPIDADVIIMDNGSDVEHLKNVEYWIENHKAIGYQLLAINSNLGYSGGNNAGIKFALENGAEYVLILNNDVVVEPDFLKKMLEVDADIVGVKEEIVFGFHYLSGVALLMKKILFFDERYFLYYEDVELSVRAPKTGFKLGTANARYTHAVSATTKSLGNADLLYYHTRNMFLLLYTHGAWYVRLALPFWAFWIKLKQKIKLIFNEDAEISLAIIESVKDYRQNKFGKR